MKKRILCFVTTLVLLIGLVPGSAFAAEASYSGSCGESLYWSFDPDTGALNITGTGEMTDYDSRWDDKKAPWTAQIGTLKITSLHIADGITHIGDYAFADLINITNVVIPGTVVSIGKYAFENTGLLEVKLPDSVKKIDSLAFRDCEDLKSVILPQFLEVIENRAFEKCTSLEALQIPATTSNVESSAFNDCTNLTHINVDEANPYYSSRDGVLYSKDQSLLIRCPGGYLGSEFVIPDSVTEIKQLAFNSCQNISSVVFPKSITKIPSATFSECPNLTTLTIPISVKAIPGSFYNTPITDVYYEGSQTDWGKISGLNDNHNEALRNATIHYNSTGDTQIEYSITYNFNDAQGTTPVVQNYPAGETVEILNQIPVRDGYAFRGWSDGTTTYQPGDVFTMPEYNTILTAMWELTSDDSQEIDQNKVFIKQSVTGRGGGTCTLASATMMIRRQAILSGINDWEAITESSVRNVAWTNKGLLLNFSFCGMNVTAYPGVDVGEMALAEKKAYFISMLEKHPEGIVIYRTDSSQWHAVLLTDYDETTDSFYCADPAPGVPTGRIPLSQCTIYSGGTQDQKIDSIDQIWYIKNTDSRKMLKSSKILTHCPVDMVFTIDGQTLDSRTTNSTISNNYATMTVTGTESDKETSVEINGPYVLEYDVAVKLIGIDVGDMTFVVEHTFTDGTTETYTFGNVPLSNTTTGVAGGFYPQSTVLLFLGNAESEDEEIWATNPNETVDEPTEDFAGLPDDDQSLVPDDGNDNTHSGTSHGSSGNSSTRSISVNAGRNGDVTVSPSRASYGDTVTITVDPDEGYELDELVATDADDDEISIRSRGDGRYTFTMPRSQVTVEAAFVEIAEEPEALSFLDVPTGAYYADAVAWAVENDVTTGTSATTFSPDMACTRAQMVTFLWRAAGSPEPETTSSPFTDVQAGSYYYDAVLWAVGQGITAGTSATTFSPDATVTRSQTMTFLWRQAGSPVVNYSMPFADVAGDAYYVEAVRWAVSEGVTSGTSATTFSPESACTRGQIVTFLYRDLAE